jgi:prevent-host-death family protein
MSHITSSELRRKTTAVLARVAAGEPLTITFDGRPVAVLRPIDRRPRFMSRDELIGRVLPAQADSALRSELRAMLPETTDDLPWRD